MRLDDRESCRGVAWNVTPEEIHQAACELAHTHSHLTPQETWRHLREGISVMAEFARLMEQV